MIDFIKQTPQPYRESRDFQLLSKLYDILFNSSRSYSDTIKSIQNGNVIDVSELRSLTSNFNPAHDWSNYLLNGIANSFNYILKSKGTISAVKYCINILLRLQGIPTNHEVIITTSENMENLFSGNLARLVEPLDDSSISTNYLYVIIPRFLATQGLVQDLLDALLPVGVTYRVIETEIIDKTFETKVKINSDSIKINKFKEDYLTLPKDEIPTTAQDIYGNEIDLPPRQIIYNKVISNADIESSEGHD